MTARSITTANDAGPVAAGGSAGDVVPMSADRLRPASLHPHHQLGAHRAEHAAEVLRAISSTFEVRANGKAAWNTWMTTEVVTPGRVQSPGTGTQSEQEPERHGQQHVEAHDARPDGSKSRWSAAARASEGAQLHTPVQAGLTRQRQGAA
jgi:hypothetical protein